MKKCKGCSHYERRTWSAKHYPADYHAIGMTHAYGYCLLYQKRCSEVKKRCSEVKKEKK